MDVQNPIIFFDGVCNLCSKSVQFVIQHDSRRLFRFAPLQGETAKRILNNQQQPGQYPDSMILWDKGRIFTRSDAALQIASRLQAPLRWLAILSIVPRSFRNWVYDTIARHRYQWFGKKESCWLPTPALKALFLD